MVFKVTLNLIPPPPPPPPVLKLPREHQEPKVLVVSEADVERVPDLLQHGCVDPGERQLVGPVTLDKEGLTLVQDDLHQVTQHGRQSLHARDLGDACRQHLALT